MKHFNIYEIKSTNLFIHLLVPLLCFYGSEIFDQREEKKTLKYLNTHNIMIEIVFHFCVSFHENSEKN